MTWIVGDGQQLELEVCGRVSAGKGGALGGRRPARVTRHSESAAGAREPRVSLPLVAADACRRLLCRRPGAALHAPRVRRNRAAPPPYRRTLRALLVARNTRLRISHQYSGM